jgi:sortase A
VTAAVASPAAAGRRPPHPLRRMLGLILILAGLGLIATFVIGMFKGVNEQHRLNSQWRQQVAADPPPATPARTPSPNLMKPVDGIDFAIRVPRLNYFAAVKEGVDSTVLYSGPGHYPQTPWPGQEGMVGVAAHNVYWITFPQVLAGDEVDIETRYGNFQYRVTGTRIVWPDDRTILVQGPGHHLTLTTCWPTWAGSFANRRFIIFTEQVHPDPEAVKSAA